MVYLGLAAEPDTHGPRARVQLRDQARRVAAVERALEVIQRDMASDGPDARR